jgi:hypothetical protein
MLRPYGPGLPSDDIIHRFGFDGEEPPQALAFFQKCGALGLRSTFAVNTYYPEIEGGYYLNPALVALVDQSLRSIGIFPVHSDCWREEGLVPIESEGRLQELQKYVLAGVPQKQLGSLNVWACYAGGGGPFYKDRVILDFILPEVLSRRLAAQVEAKCNAVSVPFHQQPTISITPLPNAASPSLWRWLTRRRF